ncbi:FAD-dependent oxidoreductase [Mycobacterium sp.]|uniref:FAD-dependent oxidoreductase n=1 Tax=Mycobacterium sp. TaxID=1785 RepID=UPI001209EA45|nr:FAD-dependent oxidoreductase [Mycobacterium sp.]TAM66370.1 MAG: cyclic nucleotide-binding domain-containing protein [Mycobacterium sp.]
MSTRTTSSAVGDEPGDGESPAETPDLYGAYPRLSDHQITALKANGPRRPLSVGETLVSEGKHSRDFFVILSGKVSITATDELGGRYVIRVHGARRFLGELADLEGQPAFYTATVIEPGEALVIPTQEVWRVVTNDPELSDLILRAYLVRRGLLVEQGSGLRIIGSCYSPDTLRLRRFAARHRLPYRWLDVERDPNAERLLRRFRIGPKDTPIVIWADKVLRNPTDADLARLVGLPVPDTAREEFDLVIIGTGPAGLSAAVYGASDGLRTAAAESVAAGGQAGTSSRIENYLGFPAGISGAELAERAIVQAQKFGARIAVSAQAVRLDRADGAYQIRLADDAILLSRAVVLATGARYRKLTIPGLDAYEGNGVYYAATYQEALMCGGGPVVVVGGGNSAGQAAVFLASRVSGVHLLIRGDDLTKSMSRYLVDQVEQTPRISIHLNTEVHQVHGNSALKTVVIQDNRTGAQRHITTSALFIFIGADPKTSWLQGTIALDDHGFIPTGPAALHSDTGRPLPTSRRLPMPLETSLPGVFAAGDVRSGSVKRVASAVGEGAMAIQQIQGYFVT